MKNYKFYIYTAISFILFFVLVSIISVPYLLKMNGSVLLDSNIASGKSQVQQLVLMNATYSKTFVAKDTIIVKLQNDNIVTASQKDSIIEKIQEDLIIPRLQNIVEDTESELLFLSVFDWSGEIKCHPDIIKVGEAADTETSDVLTMEKSISGAELYDMIYTNTEDKTSEIIYIQSIADTSLILASHINTVNFKTKIKTWRTQLYFSILILSLLILLLAFGCNTCYQWLLSK